MKSPSVGRSLWSLAFAVSAFALLTLTESLVTAGDANPFPPPQGAVAVSRHSPGEQPAEGGVRADVRKADLDDDQRARR